MCLTQMSHLHLFPWWEQKNRCCCSVRNGVFHCRGNPKYSRLAEPDVARKRYDFPLRVHHTFLRKAPFQECAVYPFWEWKHLPTHCADECQPWYHVGSQRHSSGHANIALWTTDFAQGILKSAVFLCGMCIFSKVPYPLSKSHVEKVKSK